MAEADLTQTIDAVRRFHRFYGSRLRALEEGTMGGRFSETEARVILELGLREPTSATAVGKQLGVAAGYMSRILARLHGDGLVEKTPSEEDRRRTLLTLTSRGREARAELDELAGAAVTDVLATLSGQDQERLMSAMDTIEILLGGGVREAGGTADVVDGGDAGDAVHAGHAGGATDVPAYRIRPPRPGDMGWVIRQHGILYVDEFGWNQWFEGVTADVVARFVQNLDPEREQCWIAEKDGENVGSVFCIKESEEVARLRMLLVGPEARGLGIGRRLAEECVDFARQSGYRRMTLWTYDVLSAARRIYTDLGFVLVQQASHSSFGVDMVEETWELEL